MSDEPIGLVMVRAVEHGIIIALWPPMECTGCRKPTAIGLYRVVLGLKCREWLCVTCEHTPKESAA